MLNGDLTGPSQSRGRGWSQHNNPNNDAQDTNSPAENKDASVIEESAPKSTLSAEAKEWFPPNYVAPPQYNPYHRHGNVGYHANHGNNRHGNYHHGGGGGGGGYYNRSYQQTHYQSPRYNNRSHHHAQDFEPQDSVSHLISVMCEVTMSPGKFSVLSGPLVDSFSMTLDDVEHTKPLVDAIVNQAIAEANFRYNGARLCTMFDSVEPRIEAPSVFRTCLLERCSSEESKIASGGESSDDNVCGFAMFLAELYMQLENPEGGRIKALGESLCTVLKHLLTTPNSNCTKSVCQILKLSGLALDADCKLQVDDIFNGLRASERAGVQALLVRNVINLRQSRWGSGGFAEMADTETAQPQQVIEAASYNGSPYSAGRGEPRDAAGDSSNFYLPDGHSLTREEAAFLNQHLPCDEPQDDSDNDRWDPEMNEEQRQDFMEFLRISNQISR